MKYLFLLMLLAILPGCASAPASSPGEHPLAAEDETLTVFELDDRTVREIHPLGAQLALVYEEEEKWILEPFQEAKAASSPRFVAEKAAFSVLGRESDGLWLREEETVAFLDEICMPRACISLPPEAESVLCTGMGVFYETQDAVRILEKDSGISRLLRQMPVKTMLFWGKYLAVTASYGDEPITYLLAPDTGKVQDIVRGTFSLCAGETGVFTDAAGQLLVWGKQCVPVPDGTEMLALSTDGRYALSFGAGKLCRVDVKAGTTHFQPFSAPITSAVLLPDGTVWILEAGGKKLIRWQPKGEGEPFAVFGFSTEENPDAEGFRSCESLAAKLESQYGISIAIEPSGMQIPRLVLGLEELSRGLACFPKGFLKSVDENFSILLSGRKTNYTKALVLPCGEGLTERALIYGILHCVEPKVIAVCSSFDNWNTLNPEHFCYGLAQNSLREEYAGYFCSEKAMASPTQDRAELLYYAVGAGNAELFSSAPMQRKLLRLCTGIRKTFHLERDPTIFRWEQYLYQTLAPPG